MHYYQFNIADYRKDTMHLTPIEHYIYRALMDTYYLSEKPLSLDHDDLMRSHCLRSADDMRALCAVLKDFFIADEIGYAHKRCDIEIEAFHTKSKIASESAKARWDRIRCERIANALQSQSDGNANHKPRTSNQEPKTGNSKDLSAPSAQTEKKGTRLPADWVLQKAWGEWALEEKPNWTAEDVRRVADGFRDHWLANANQTKSKKADWLATWRNWVRSPLNDIKSAKPANKHTALVDSNRAAADEWLRQGERTVS